MDKQLFSLIVVFLAFGLNLLVTLFSKSFAKPERSASCVMESGNGDSVIEYRKMESLESTIILKDQMLRDNAETIHTLNMRVSQLEELVKKTEKLLASARNELSMCLMTQSDCSAPSDEVVVFEKPDPPRRRMASPVHPSFEVHPESYDWKRSKVYFEESVKKRPPQKVSMNVEVTIFILCGNCTMRTKYPSESIDILNKWYPLVKIYLSEPNDPTAAEQIHKSLAEVSTKYVLFVDSSVEFTHNSNLKRMLSLLESNQLSVVSPMTEDAKTQLLEGGCFDYRYHNHALRIRRGYGDTLSGNAVRCERGGRYFMGRVETVRQMLPNQPLPLTLLWEAFYLELKAFNHKVGFCPVSIFKRNAIAAANGSADDVRSCDVFTQPFDSIDERSKRAFSTKYHVSQLVHPDGRVDYFPEPLYDTQEEEGVYRSSAWYRQQQAMFYMTSDILRNATIPFVLAYEDLVAAVLLGVPFPWTDTIQGFATMNPRNGQHCDYFRLAEGTTMKQIGRYGLDILNNEEDKEVCFGINVGAKYGANEDTPIGVVVRNLPFRDILPMMLPLKKIRYLDVEVMVPNNPIAFLEKVFEQGNDALQEVNVFVETGSKREQWEKCLKEGDVTLSALCANSPFEWASDIEDILRNSQFYV